MAVESLLVAFLVVGMALYACENYPSPVESHIYVTTNVANKVSTAISSEVDYITGSYFIWNYNIFI